MTSTLKKIDETKVGKTEVRMFRTGDSFVGVVVADGAKPLRYEGDDPEVLWRKLLAEVGRAHPDYFGFDGARARFLKYFPNGFADTGYLFHERDYKDKAVAKIGSLLPLEAAKDAGAEACAAAVKAFQSTNLVFQVEKARIKEVLLGPSGPAFLNGAARFAEGDFPTGIDEMLGAIRVTTQASWPMLTYLPFMWRPDDNLFLKPQVTCDFANRVGHSFARDYTDGLVPAVYDSLMHMAAQTRAEIADLKPRDLIDVQSFIWVMGGYKPDEPITRPEAPAGREEG